ncbi:MAG: ferritin family protein [Candidatus Zixiibacteriota bacterium]
MSIFDFAMKMEMDGKRFYEQQADSSSDNDLKEIFRTLAEEEQRHFDFFRKLKDGRTEDAARELTESGKRLKSVQNIFQKMSTDADAHSFGESEKQAWTMALRIEEEAEQFYREKVKIESDDSTRKLLVLIADEEQRHIHMISGVLTYIQSPSTFADSAQFRDFMSLEGH